MSAGDTFNYSPEAWSAAKGEAIAILREVARSQSVIAYSDLTKQIRSLDLDARAPALAGLLGQISEEENAAGRGMLSVVVVHKEGDGLPGDGFFDLARVLGRETRDRVECWVAESKQVYAAWRDVPDDQAAPDPAAAQRSEFALPMDQQAIETLIPHREPFLLIDRVTELVPGQRAVAEHTFTGKEWYLRGHFPGNPIVPGVILAESMAQCVPLDAQILSRGGFRRCDEIVVGEEVLAYDAASDSCRWTPLRAISMYQRQRTVVLSSRSFLATCTPEHTWAIRLNSTPVVRKLVPTTRLQQLGRHAGNAIVTAAPADDGPSVVTPDEAAILGWVATDGWVQRTGNQLRVNITQSKPHHLERIRALVGADASEYIRPAGFRTFPAGYTSPTRETHHWGLRAEAGKRLFQRAGISGRRDLPALVTRLSHPARAAMLQAMLQGDAHQRISPLTRTGRTFTFGQDDPNVREAFQILCALEGLALGKPQYGPEPNFVRQTVRSNRVVDLGHLRIEEGPEMDVWCPTTDYGTWLMRWNGYVTITGNTATVMAMALPEYRDGLGLFAGIDEMRFKRIVRPGETGRFEATMDKMRRGYARVAVRTLVGDELAAEGTIQAIFQPRAKG